MEKLYLAVDQHGQTFRYLKHPRKELCAILGRQHVAKMYVDKVAGPNAGKSVHVGYVIAGLWLTLYEMKPVELSA